MTGRVQVYTVGAWLACEMRTSTLPATAGRRNRLKRV